MNMINWEVETLASVYKNIIFKTQCFVSKLVHQKKSLNIISQKKKMILQSDPYSQLIESTCQWIFFCLP